MEGYNLLKNILKERNITGVQLSEMLGKSKDTVSLWCRNKSQPKLEDLYRIAALLKIDVYDLLPLNKEGEGLWVKREKSLKEEEEGEQFPYNRIGHYLKEKGIHGNKLSKALGVEKGTVSRWRQNRMQPRIQMLFAIGKYLRVNPRKLLSNVEYGEGGEE